MKMMNHGRRNFLKKGMTGLAGAAVAPALLKGHAPESDKKKKGKLIWRKLGNTGIKLPIVSMGVMNADNPNLVRAALDSGIVHLDTAWIYQKGRNEEMVGKVLRDYPRDSVVVATKIREAQDRETGLFTDDATPKSFMEKFETSMKRLGLDYVDILYLHSVKNKESAMFEPYLKLMQKLKKEGRIRHIGLSTHRNEPEVLRAAADSGVYEVVLTAYNFRQKHRAEVESAIAYAAQKGLGIVAMKTQAGVYWDKEKLHPINMKAALKWALKNPHVHTAIPGFTTFDQLEDDMSVMSALTMTPEEENDLKKGEKLGLAGLYCQHCGHCVPQCPKGVDIPTHMRSYMYAFGYRNLQEAQRTYRSLKTSGEACADCRSCMVRCSMGFDVRERITKIIQIDQIAEDFLV